MGLHEEKSRLRQLLKQRRDGLGGWQRQEKSRQILKNIVGIMESIHAKSVFCYISYLTEVETGPILDHFLKHDLHITVPKIIDKTVMHAVPFSSWGDTQSDKMGILTPIADEHDPGPFDVALTPGLGFTRHGARLGYGRGYYDRWFVNYTVKTRIGICFEAQIVDNLPMEETDILLQMLITEKSIYDLRA